MLSKHEEQEERRKTLINDAKVRNQGSTFHQFGTSEAEEVRGRFSAISSPDVIGSTPSPASQYPAGPNWTVDPVPAEMPLGVDINAIEPCGEPHELRASVASPLEPACAQGFPGELGSSSINRVLDVEARRVRRSSRPNRRY